MKRTTISLPDDLVVALEREARRGRQSRSEVARVALRAYLLVGNGDARELPFAAVGHNEAARPAAELDQLLREEWAGHIERDSFDDRGR